MKRLAMLEALLSASSGQGSAAVETRLEGDRGRTSWGGLPLTTMGGLHPEAAWLLIEAVIRARPRAQEALVRHPILVTIASKPATLTEWSVTLSCQTVIKLPAEVRRQAAEFAAMAGLTPKPTPEARRHGTSFGNDGGWRILAVLRPFADPAEIAQALADPRSTDDAKEAKAMLRAYSHWRAGGVPGKSAFPFSDQPAPKMPRRFRRGLYR